MVSIGTLALSKWGLIAIFILILYFTGAFNVILKNPALIFFGIIALVVIYASGDKK